MRRRPLLVAGLASAGAPAVFARPAPGAPPLRLGVDRALAESGLAQGLQRAFGADTGIAVKLVVGPVLGILDAIKEGEVDAALANAPAAEADLDRQGLVHDWRPVAVGEFIVVGPAGRTRTPPVAPGRGAETLARIRALAMTEPGSVVFLSAGDGSGTHVAEQALWRAAALEPVAPWYVKADPAIGFAAQVRSRGAYALVERSAWQAAGGAGQPILAEADPDLSEVVHAMRAFRVNHPAGKIFVAWIAGGRGHRVVAGHRGYRRPA